MRQICPKVQASLLPCSQTSEASDDVSRKPANCCWVNAASCELLYNLLQLLCLRFLYAEARKPMFLGLCLWQLAGNIPAQNWIVSRLQIEKCGQSGRALHRQCAALSQCSVGVCAGGTAEEINRRLRPGTPPRTHLHLYSLLAGVSELSVFPRTKAFPNLRYGFSSEFAKRRGLDQRYCQQPDWCGSRCDALCHTKATVFW